jgi:dienelactone hydrolase
LIDHLKNNIRQIISIAASILIAWLAMIILFVGNSLAAYVIAMIGIIITLIVLIVPTYGWKGLRDYLSSLTRQKTNLIWYIISIILPLSITISALAAYSLIGGKLPPITTGSWNLPYVAKLVTGFAFVSVLGVSIAGFFVRESSQKSNGFIRAVIFCISMVGAMAPILLAAIAGNPNNIWLFLSLIPAAFVALWIYERSGKSLLTAGLFILSIVAFELMSPANWFLNYDPLPMMLGSLIVFLAAIAIIITDREFFFSPIKDGVENVQNAPQKRLLNIPLILSSIAIIATIISAAYILAENSTIGYPEPTGPYKVGKVAYDWIDPARPEIATGNTTNRELMVYIWYPADVPAGSKEAIVTDAKTAGSIFTKNTFSLGFLKDVSDHTYSDVPLSANSTSYPILLMSHGDSSSPLSMTAMATGLASHGYIVVGISHTYNADGTVFPDGRVLKREFNYSLIQDTDYNFSLTYFQNNRIWYDHNANVESAEAADQSFVLDKVEQLNQSDPVFKGGIDMGRVGSFGHSLGGAVAITSLERDSRIKAAADLDGMLYHNVTSTKPTMLFERGSLINYDRPYDDLNKRLMTPEEFRQFKLEWDGYETTVFTNPPTAYYVAIKGTEHGNFKDFGVLNIPIDTGSIDGKYAWRIINEYLLAFFNKTLNGGDSPLLHGESAYPEVVFKGHEDEMPVAG